MRLVEAPRPEPSPGEVLVKVGAVALNYRDLAILEGTMGAWSPHSPGSDMAGEVVAVGKGVSRFSCGDRVQVVVVQGTGGVSLSAVQSACAHGARVIVASSSSQKIDRLQKLHPSQGIDRSHNPEWERLSLVWNRNTADALASIPGFVGTE